MRGRHGLHPRTGDSVISLYLNSVTLASLPARCSRHNAPARPHSLASVVKNVSSGRSETIIVSHNFIVNCSGFCYGFNKLIIFHVQDCVPIC